MKSAGILLSRRQIVLAVIIGNSVQIYRLKDVNDLLKVLSTAKPDVVGIESTAAELFDDVYYSFNAVKIESVTDINIKEADSRLTKLNIVKNVDENKAIAVAYIAGSNLEKTDSRIS